MNDKLVAYGPAELYPCGLLHGLWITLPLDLNDCRIYCENTVSNFLVNYSFRGQTTFLGVLFCFPSGYIRLQKSKELGKVRGFTS